MPRNYSVASRKKKMGRKVKEGNHSLGSKLIGLMFLTLALAIFFLPPILSSSRINNESIRISASLISPGVKQSNPIRILIPKLDIDLKVVDAKIVSGYWELSEDTASYGLGSGQLGTKSNTVIFAHARQGLFYNLKDAQVDDIVYVFTKDKWFRYRINKITSVYPSQTEVIGPTKGEVLTLYTCTGFYDEKRLIVTAIPQS